MNSEENHKNNSLCVYAESSIKNCLEKININKLGSVIVLDSADLVIGILTDGDIRRGILCEGQFFLDRCAGEAVRKDFVFGLERDTFAELDSRLSDRIRLIPILDSRGHLTRIHTKISNSIFLSSRVISQDHPSFVIAELGNNHNGDIETGKKLIKAAKDAGADAVKFQHRVFSQVYRSTVNPSSSGIATSAEDLGAEYVIDLINKFSLSIEDLNSLFDYAKELDILPFCTPWDLASLDELSESSDLELFKIASADLTNHELLKAVAQTGKPLIVSTGMSAESEIVDSIACLESLGAKFALLHCNSTYPTPLKDINLAYLGRLKELSRGRLVGYSGHERGYLVPIAAVALGARIVEKHLTLDREMEGNDHRVSLLPDEFARMVADIRAIEEATGGIETRKISQGELINRESLAKSLVANTDISRGSIISRDMVEIRSPGRGIQPDRIDELVGKKAVRDIRSGDFFYKADLVEKKVGEHRFDFSRLWGVPVRFHDYNEMTSISPDLGLVEFHLSYKDLEVNLDNFDPIRKDMKLVIHAPELFENDHLLDLASQDSRYRKKSIKHMQSLINFCSRLSSMFPTQQQVQLVTNVGGFELSGFDPVNIRAEKYRLLEDSLNQLEFGNVCILPQTMPPFPWHFGGQSHHNLFVRPDEIRDFCEKNGLKICLDVSHSVLACRYLGISLTQLFQSVGHLVDHMHIADADGVDGEGLTIGEGSLDFDELSNLVSETVPSSASWIPEVWQGHKNSGEGFLDALVKLSKYSTSF